MLSLSIVRPIVYRGALILSKHSPTLFMSAGIIGSVASTVLACKATLQSQDIIEEVKELLELARQTYEIDPDNMDTLYSERKYREDLARIYLNGGIKIAKLYAPSLILGGLSIGSIIYGQHILNGRNIALMAAYKALDEAYTQYRNRVIASDPNGKLLDNKYRFGELAETKDLNEEEKTNLSLTYTPSMYATWFDVHSSPQWTNSHEVNLYFLRVTERYIQDMLTVRGHAFLNEAYDALGLPRTKAGAVVGWIGPDLVDFGLNNPFNEPNRDEDPARNPNFLLDFNVSGVIYDMIE